ncbi:hypothetical protein ASC64_08260 [Nocardioides sp. Root122]|uniref:hypothetical protein n=1 Tax=Nocardioides TaxID=1839 RepID=UPI00070341C5|nr:MULTISPECIES: hypothetical protein [Nocardioides]KQV69804.1 hypothetical protein ASC64_08260 [Nocardioides sp. Root122]MCK9822984.1 hypothetical protein [Nocardioides cavernae]
MSGLQEGHGRPESGPPGGLVEVLERWELAGGRWEVLASSDTWIDIGLFPADGGDQVSRVSGARTSVLRSFLAGRTTNAERG